MAARSVIPVIILTGFLGSGKTTLLANWIRAPQFAQAMVIVNELGEVGLDAHLMQTSSEMPVLLENGCACCTGAEDLNATLERLFWDRLQRRIAPFNWVLIETSGAADPGAMIAAMNANPVVRERYALAGIVTVLDGLHGPALAAQRSECAAQIQHADLIIITRADRAAQHDIENARIAATARNQFAGIALSRHGDLPAQTIADLATAPVTQRRDVSSPRFAHGAGLASAFVPLETAISAIALEHALSLFIAEYADDLLRIKGVVAAIEDGLRIVQWIPGAPCALLAPAPFAAANAPRNGLTIICAGQAHMQAKRLEVLLAGTAAPPQNLAQTPEVRSHAI